MSRPHYYDRAGQPLGDGDFAADTIEWGQLRDDESYMRIGMDTVDNVVVTTVWQGINLALGADPPRIFETRIFGGPHDLEGMFYTTEDEARQGHSQTVDDINNGRAPWFLEKIPNEQDPQDI